MGREWSALQRAIFDNVKSGVGHTVVEARAGSGKTSTAIEALNYVPPACRTLMVAFNKSIARELGERVPQGVRVSTLHGHGFGAIKRELGSDIRVEEHKNRRLLAEKFEAVDRAIRVAACKAAGFAKGHLLPDRTLSADPLLQIENMIAEHWIGDFEREEDSRRCAELTLWLLEQAKEAEESIDFDDMIWLPVVQNMSLFKNDRVFVDELQDLNRCQHELVARSVKRDGRICGIGDRRQCIPAGQFVSTPGGPRLIEDLHEGDEVLAAKAGRTQTRRVVRVVSTTKSEAFEFDLGEHGKFRATAEHVLFAAIDDPMGAFVYLMYRPDLGFRIGVSRTVGRRGKSFVVRTQQECAERLWVLEWFETYSEGAEVEAHLAYKFGVPREPFVPRNGMWSGSVEATSRLFELFGTNGHKVLEHFRLDFDRPNYFAKASGRGRIAVNLLLGTKDGHRLEVETGHVDEVVASGLGMLPTHRGTFRRRSNFRSLWEARLEAARVAESLDGYIVEHLSGAGDTARRMLAVPAASVNVGMRVPVVLEDGSIGSAPVRARRRVAAGRCFDLEVDELGTFVVNGVVVHNSIYFFRGADRTSMDRFAQTFDAGRLPLSITYRCPKKVVELVKTIVPDYEAHPSNPEGVVEDVRPERMEAEARPGDCILSRTNAPLIPLCLRFLKEGQRAMVMGRDIAQGLLTLIDRSKAFDVQSLRTWTIDWAQREVEKAQKRDADTPVGYILDRRDCLLALADDASSVDEVRDRIARLFVDGNPLDAIALSTTHRFKGLERPRVWMLRDTYLRWNDVEEENLFYVAATRAQRELYLVRGEL